MQSNYFFCKYGFKFMHVFRLIYNVDATNLSIFVLCFNNYVRINFSSIPCINVLKQCKGTLPKNVFADFLNHLLSYTNRINHIIQGQHINVTVLADKESYLIVHCYEVEFHKIVSHLYIYSRCIY